MQYKTIITRPSGITEVVYPNNWMEACKVRREEYDRGNAVQTLVRPITEANFRPPLFTDNLR
jgi:hypothetical protein